jgi:hypothetical protein
VGVGHANHSPDHVGVTVVVPRLGDDHWLQPVPIGCAVLNGAGEISGLAQVREWGVTETPVFLGAQRDARARPRCRVGTQTSSVIATSSRISANKISRPTCGVGAPARRLLREHGCTSSRQGLRGRFLRYAPVSSTARVRRRREAALPRKLEAQGSAVPQPRPPDAMVFFSPQGERLVARGSLRVHAGCASLLRGASPSGTP